MNKKIFLLILFPVIVLAISGYTDWRRIGPGGGGVIVDVICHPTNPNIVWVETDLTGIFKSTDGGENFRRMSGPIERKERLFEWMRGLDHELVYDLSDPNIMYWAMDGGIYTVPGLYKSTDDGETWFKVPGSPDLAPGAIVVDYNGVIYGIKHKKMYVSTDKGKTWIRKPDVPTYYSGDDYSWRRYHRIFVYTTRDNKIIIGDRRNGTGIFYTSDKGNTWHNVLKGTEIMDVACSPTTPGLVMALEQDGRIFRSNDGCKSFKLVKTIKSSYHHWNTQPAYWGGIAINKDNYVMAIGRYEMAVSKDAGLHFTVYEENQCKWNPGDYIFPNRQTNTGLFKCNRLAASPAPNRWYSAGGELLKRSDDNGKSWLGLSNGIDILCVYSPPVVDETNPNIIQVGAGDNGQYYTTDCGKTWHSAETKMETVDAIAQDPNNPDIYYKMYRHPPDKAIILKSFDRGMTWKEISTIPSNFIYSDKDSTFYNKFLGAMKVDPTNSNRIYACNRATDGLYESEDGGKSFRIILKLVHPWQLEVTKKGTVFICSWDSKGLFRSTDHGRSFVDINNGMVNDFEINPKNENIIYVNVGSLNNAWASARVLPTYEKNRYHGKPGKGKLYKTVDGGKHWKLLGSFDGFAIYIAPNFPNIMLMSTREGGKGIVKSTDAGITWKSIHNSHNNYVPRGFVYGGVPGRVYTWNHNLERIDNIQVNKFEGDNKTSINAK